MTAYIIEMTDADLADMTVGRFLREGQTAVDRINADGVLAWICEDNRVAANMAIDPHRNWLLVVLAAIDVQLAAVLAGILARATGPEYQAPWWDESEAP